MDSEQLKITKINVSEAEGKEATNSTNERLIMDYIRYISQK